MNVFFLIAVLLLESSTAGRAGTSRSPQPVNSIAEIDSFCDGLAAFTKGGAKPRRFGLYQKDDRDKGKWREYRDKTKLRGDVDAHTVFDVAEVWSRPDRGTAVSMTFGSDSGDWVEFADYCFRPDGGLARMLSTLNTFNAVIDDGPDVQGVHRERLRHFAVGGSQLKVASTVVELTTRKPVPGVQFMDRDDEVHITKKRSHLPFADLLGGP